MSLEISMDLRLPHSQPVWRPEVIKCHHLVLYNTRMRRRGVRSRAWAGRIADVCAQLRGFSWLSLVEFYPPTPRMQTDYSTAGRG